MLCVCNFYFVDLPARKKERERNGKNALISVTTFIRFTESHQCVHINYGFPLIAFDAFRHGVFLVIKGFFSRNCNRKQEEIETHITVNEAEKII